ncbi:MAG TPA: hypothetical protein VJ695_07925 [Nitrososphaera sp.]|nr:hypothetical protein [Nitrososphaera sp.]
MSNFDHETPPSISASNNSRYSENISFRIAKVLLNQLRQEAKEDQITLNTLVNKIIDSYVNFTSNAPKAGMIPIHRLCLITLLEGYNEEEVKEIARRFVKAISVQTPLLLRGKYDFEAVLESHRSWIKAAGFQYRYSKDAEKNRHTFIVEHDMGKKFSLFAIEYAKLYFEPVVRKEVECSFTDNTIMIVLEGKKE